MSNPEETRDSERRPDFEVAAFVPYRINSVGEFEFFLQRRTDDAPSDPSMMGFFGGGRKNGETIEQCLLREVEQELKMEIKIPKRYSRKPFIDETLGPAPKRIRALHLFYQKVSDSFEQEVLEKGIHEGEPLGSTGSRFITLRELIAMSNHSPHLCDPRVIKVLSMLSAKL